MSAPRLATLAVVALIALVLVTRGGDEDRYTLTANLTDAAGLRSGADVVIGGVHAGKVKLSLDKETDRVRVELKLDDDRGPVGRDASFAIASVNLLGQKRVELDPGDRDRPAPSGTSIPSRRVTRSTDLDQVLDVLDTGTRARLGVLINEAGTAFTGRKGDFIKLLEEFPTAMVGLRQVVQRATVDTQTVGDLVQRSDRFVAELTQQRRQITRVIDSVGQTAKTVAARRAALAKTLRAAPGTLGQLQGFLAELQQTTEPLGPAARDISRSAPSLRATLDELEPFRKAADPTLAEITDVSPTLTRLATGATPVLKRTVPTLRALAQTANDLAPVSKILDQSTENLFATVENWSRAVQLRDGLSHVFRAEASVSPKTFDYALNRLVGNPSPRKRKKSSPKTAAVKQQASAPSAAAAPTPAAPAPMKTPQLKLPDISKTVNDTVDGLLGVLKNKPKPPAAETGAQRGSSVSALLDYLLKP
ncbi:hypothetical protein DSM112329_00342 [Paraconexibacter sp. AEG42_29]|uniref:MlaD family protein n=1 Tax=Paraconexibacter sp. AEG42_29 TaxID=2997339 RepID=UPI00339D7275